MTRIKFNSLDLFASSSVILATLWVVYYTWLLLTGVNKTAPQQPVEVPPKAVSYDDVFASALASNILCIDTNSICLINLKPEVVWSGEFIAGREIGFANDDLVVWRTNK